MNVVSLEQSDGHALGGLGGLCLHGRARGWCSRDSHLLSAFHRQSCHLWFKANTGAGRRVGEGRAGDTLGAWGMAQMLAQESPRLRMNYDLRTVRMTRVSVCST